MFQFLKKVNRNINRINYKISKQKNIKLDYSYGNFLKNNPKASRKDRLKAIKKFMDETRK